MIRVVLLKSGPERAIGLIGMRPIPPGTLFVFPDVAPGTIFHSRGVLEPFDIAFLDEDGRPILITEIIPPDGLIAAPPGTRTVVEAKRGTLRGFSGFSGNTNEELPSKFAFPIVTAVVGLTLMIIGFKKRREVLGAVLLGVGGSIFGISLRSIIRS